MDLQSNCLFITYVEKEGPFLKVWGQTDKNTSLYIEQVLHSFTSQFDNGLCIPHPESLQIGILCCAKYKDNKYYRARVTSLNYLQNRYIEVNFVDYGHKDVVPVSNIRSLEGFETSFISIHPQAACFLLAEAVCPRGEWNDGCLDEIAKEIRYTEVNFSIVAQVTRHYLVRLFVGVNDLAIILISKGLMRHTSLTTQEAVLLSMMPRASLQQPAAQQNIATYKAFTLEPGSQYEVYVSYVTDGPCNFSVQLKQSEEMLGKLMKEINSMTLTPIEGIPIPGTVCLARCMEDGHICRAVVTNEVDGQFKVFYVDFGNFEVVSLEALYEIPFKYVIPKVMAIRFALAGVEKSTVTLEMQCAFKKFVDNRLIHMRVMPMTTRSSLPRCELWDPESQISALDIVNQAASAGYPDHIFLNRGFSQLVKVSFVYSCNKFYVQLRSKQDELMKLMLDIQILCRDVEPLNSNLVKVGLPCFALFEGDQQWYRGQIVEVLEGGKSKVYYVDYGNEDVVPVSYLKPIEGKQLTILRPQAIECCLNGYQNMDPDLERDNLLEELIFDQEFTMKVVEMQGKKALVELIDSANYNVASLLLDKIATTRSQVSPMLVQAGNKIEHRKNSQPLNQRQEQRKPERGQKQWEDNISDNTTWRQDNRGPRNNFETNESNDNNSWRQNNKGFKNSDRRENDFNDSTDSEKQSNKSFGRNDRNRNDINARNNDGGSWKQNKGFNNKNQDTFRDNNKSNEWGGDDRKNEDWSSDKRAVSSPVEDTWGGNKDGRSKYNPREKNQDNWSSNRDNNRPKFNSRDNTDDWNSNRENDKRNFNSRENDGWNGDNKQEKDNDWGNRGDRRNDNWGNKGARKDFPPRDKDGFRKSRPNRLEEGGGEWNSESQTGGFKKREFKRETSELSSSGSEKSFRKGFNKDNKFRDKNSKPNFNKKFDKSPRNNDSSDTWNVSTSTAIEVPNAAPSTAKFTTLKVDQTEANVIISWFHNPANFYCQIANTQDEFKRTMEDIQQAYKGRPPSTAVVGAPIIGLFPEDRVLYRAEVVEVIGSQYKIYYVDFGNVSVIDKVWPIETRFMELPAQAICCKLEGVDPPGDTWPDANNYGHYFDKGQFFCRFLSTENDRVAIKLEYNNEDIASLLVRDGLAKPALLPPQPELPLLIGQQFRAMLISVNSLADFSMSLQSGALLSCSIFNLSESTETFEQNLKEKVGQILIVYVDDLKEDRLEVTLYDQNGLKIKLIDRDESAYESVEIICPYLIMNSTLSGEVTHVEGTTVFIQPSDCIQNIEYLLNTCYEFYENSTLPEPIQPTEGFVYAVKGSDTNWYRGRVTSVEENQVTVNYIDYGNSEQISVDVLRELTTDFMELQIMCVGVTINNATEELIAKTVQVNLVFTENGLEGTVAEEQTPTYTEPVTEVPVVEQAPEVTQIPTETVGVIGTQVVLSHTDSPSDFYLQFGESLEAIEQLQARLQEQIPEMADMENPVVGVLCAAPYSLDQQWYRAQVLDADTDITTVRFVDYGNTDVLDNHSTRVKTLPSDLLALEVHATRCRLKIKPVDEEWTSAATEKFEALCDVEGLTVQFINQDEKTNYVELYSNGTNIREVLIQENLALPDEITEASSSVGFVSHLNSPSEFWIQLENCVEELEWVAEQLSGAESFAELEDLAPGTLCAALFPDDQMWYRARILSNTVAGIEVLFVDYGNSCTSCSLRELPEDLVMLPPLAQKCSLQKPETLTGWGPEMVRKFSEISADGQTTFHVKKLSTGETASVELSLDGVDVVTLLLPNTEDVCVKSHDGLSELVLVKDGKELPTKYKLEDLPDTVWNEESSKKFTEMNNDGKTVFQAEFVSDDTVRLYLGLNDIRLDLSGLKTTSPTSSPMKIRTDPTKFETYNDMKDIIDDVVEASVNADGNKDLVCEIVDSTLDHDNNAFVEGLVSDVINNSTILTNSSVEDEIVDKTITNCLDNIDIHSPSLVPENEHQSSTYADTTVSKVADSAITNFHIAEAPSLLSHDSNSVVEDIVSEILDKTITNSNESNTYADAHSQDPHDSSTIVAAIVSEIVDKIITDSLDSVDINATSLLPESGHESNTSADPSVNETVDSCSITNIDSADAHSLISQDCNTIMEDLVSEILGSITNNVDAGHHTVPDNSLVKTNVNDIVEITVTNSSLKVASESIQENIPLEENIHNIVTSLLTDIVKESINQDASLGEGSIEPLEPSKIPEDKSQETNVCDIKSVPVQSSTVEDVRQSGDQPSVHDRIENTGSDDEVTGEKRFDDSNEVPQGKTSHSQIHSEAKQPDIDITKDEESKSEEIEAKQPEVEKDEPKSEKELEFRQPVAEVEKDVNPRSERESDSCMDSETKEKDNKTIVETSSEVSQEKPESDDTQKKTDSGENSSE